MCVCLCNPAFCCQRSIKPVCISQVFWPHHTCWFIRGSQLSPRVQYDILAKGLELQIRPTASNLTVESDVAPFSVDLSTAYHRAQNWQAWRVLMGMATSIGQATWWWYDDWVYGLVHTHIWWQGHCVQLWSYEMDIHKGEGEWFAKSGHGEGAQKCQNFVDVFYCYSWSCFCMLAGILCIIKILSNWMFAFYFPG